MSRKHWLVAVALLAVFALALAGCGGSGGSSGGSGSTGTGSTNGGSSDGGSSDGGSADTAFKAAMVTDVGGINDASFNAAAWRGLEKLKADFGAEVTYIESNNPDDYVNNLTTFAETQPQDIVWSIGFMMTDATTEVAGQFPDKKFGIIDGVVEGRPNVASVLFKEHEGSFLVGILAARSTESKVVGFVGGMPGDVIGRFEAGFRAGVAYADPSVKVEVIYSGVFDDPGKGKQDANTLIARGADVIFHAAGYTGNGVIEAAKDADIKAIGVDSDQKHLAPDHVISSMMKMVDVAVYEISKRAMEGNFPGGELAILGLAEDAVGWSDTTVFPNDAVKAEMEQAKKDIVDGKLQVPATPDEATEFENERR